MAILIIVAKIVRRTFFPERPAVLLIRSFALALGMLFPFSAVVQAELPAASGEVVLMVDGAVSAPTESGFALDMEGLKSLPTVSFRTSTIWTEGVLEFTGVPLKALVEQAGGAGSVVVAEALNGYAVDIPLEALEENAPIVAYLIDGQPFSRRDKGPLWVVFPYDLDEKFKSEITYAYSIWQLQRLTVK